MKRLFIDHAEMELIVLIKLHLVFTFSTLALCDRGHQQQGLVVSSDLSPQSQNVQANFHNLKIENLF